MQPDNPIAALSYATRGIKRRRDWSITIGEWVGVWVIAANVLFATVWFAPITIFQTLFSYLGRSLIAITPYVNIPLVLLAFAFLALHHFAVNFWGRGGKYSHWLPSRQQLRVCLLLFVGLALSCGAALLIGQAMANFARAVGGDESAHEEEMDTSATDLNSISTPSNSFVSRPAPRSSSSDLLREESHESLPIRGFHFIPLQPLEWR